MTASPINSHKRNVLSVDSQPLTNLTDRLGNLQHEGYSPNTGQYI